MREAKVEVMQWQHQYNNVRPHSSLNYLPPVVFANKAAKIIGRIGIIIGLFDRKFEYRIRSVACLFYERV